MTKAFLDTSVLVNALLKVGSESDRAKASFKKFDELLLSGYALKEFKRGAFGYYIWLHNKVVTTGNWAQAIEAVASVWRQKNRMLTAMKAVADCQSSIAKVLVRSGKIASSDDECTELEAREARIWLKTKIFRAWKAQESSDFRRVMPLSCYDVQSPRESLGGLIDNRPMKCTLGNCCLKSEFLANSEATTFLHDACDKLAVKPEMAKRRSVLKDILRKPKSPLSERDCIALGDAVFALQCPSEAVVLTTNIVDHEPLAIAVGKSVVSP